MLLIIDAVLLQLNLPLVLRALQANLPNLRRARSYFPLVRGRTARVISELSWSSRLIVGSNVDTALPAMLSKSQYAVNLQLKKAVWASRENMDYLDVKTFTLTGEGGFLPLLGLICANVTSY